MRTLLALSLSLFVAACGCSSSSSSSGGGAPTGSNCSTSSQCSTALCVTSSDFTSGYCTKGCSLSDATSCPSGSVCIDDASGVPADAGIKAICYQSCTSDSDCAGLQYKCLEKSSHMVCRNGG